MPPKDALSVKGWMCGLMPKRSLVSNNEILVRELAMSTEQCNLGVLLIPTRRTPIWSSCWIAGLPSPASNSVSRWLESEECSSPRDLLSEAFRAGPHVTFLNDELLLVLHDREFAFSDVTRHVVHHVAFRRVPCQWAARRRLGERGAWMLLRPWRTVIAIHILHAFLPMVVLFKGQGG